MLCKSKVEELFFRILRTALWGGSIDVEADAVSRDEVMAALKMAKAQAVLGLVANEALRCERLSGVLGDEDKMRLKRFVMGNLSTCNMLNGTLVSIVMELRKHGIDPVLLKGQGIAKYYPVPELRQCGDIDIYTRSAIVVKTSLCIRDYLTLNRSSATTFCNLNSKQFEELTTLVHCLYSPLQVKVSWQKSLSFLHSQQLVHFSSISVVSNTYYTTITTELKN